MQKWQGRITEVLIVGAGPTGLMMACQLAMHRVSFCIIDVKDSPSKNSGALIVQARSLEIFQQLGIAREAINKGIIANKVNIIYNGKKIACSFIKDIGGNLSQFPFLLMLEQSKTENLLLDFIHQYGYTVERGIRFKSFIQENDEVISSMVLPDETEQLIKTKYVIAADGSQSSIRNFLNIPFTGKTYAKPIFILDCKANTKFIDDEINFVFSNSTVTGFFPLKDSRWRIDGAFPKEIEKQKTVTIDFIEKEFHLWTRINIEFHDFEWFSVFHSHQKYAKSIRIQNCFLIGDAAHVNTPVGAQGMNTGLQDAWNLAWKLSLVIKQKAKPALLNTYFTERFCISKGFARYADTVFKLLTSSNVLVKFFRFYVLRVLLKYLFPLIQKQKTFRENFFKSISQIGIQYKNSPLSYKKSNWKFVQNFPRPGERWPYFEFLFNGRNTNSYEILKDACFNMIVFAEVLPEEIKTIAERYNLSSILIPLILETKGVYNSFGIKNNGYFLIRPDLYISLLSANLNSKHLNNYLQKFLIV